MNTERDIIINTIAAGIEASCFIVFVVCIAMFWVGTP